MVGLEIVETDIPVSQITEFSEAFATSTTKVLLTKEEGRKGRAAHKEYLLLQGVMPITKIDGITVGDGNVGPVVSTLMKAFDEEVSALEK